MRFFYLTICIFLSFLHNISNAQNTSNISKPILALEDSAVIIRYDILGSTMEDKFNVSLVITDSIGNDINAISFSGDIGKDVNGGSGKKIIWNFLADQSDVNEMLYFQVLADKVMPGQTENVQNVQAEDIPAEEIANNSSGITKEQTFNRGSLIFQSMLMPGTGLTLVKQKPHWVKGVLAYGALASSVAFYTKSNDNYNSYLNAVVKVTRDNLYDKTKKQESIANTLLYSAIGIWTADFIWTMIGTKDINKENKTARMSVQPLYIRDINASVLTLTYRF